jgi:hypothetical protein
MRARWRNPGAVVEEPRISLRFHPGYSAHNEKKPGS